MENILDILEVTCKKHPNKYSFCDENSQLTFKELCEHAKQIGSFLAQNIEKNKAVAIFLDKSVENVICMFGVLYSGCFYTEMDVSMPIERILKVFETLEPAVIITDSINKKKLPIELNQTKILYYEDIKNSKTSEKVLSQRKKMRLDSDLAYVLYTSGSTGAPKGVAISHRALLAYIIWACNTFAFDEETVFGSQAPFYFSMSVTDVYSTVFCGATFWIIPKTCFLFPMNLMKMLNEKKINTIYWVPSAYRLIVQWKVFDVVKPMYIKKALFAGEVMQPGTLEIWMRFCPKNTLFANLFGPTETTDICTYYIIPAEWENNSSEIPIGKACSNCEIMIINDNGVEAGTDEPGEMYVRGAFLAEGYYRNWEKTNLVFIQNPLNSNYPETVYKSGDIVRKDKDGIIHYLGRKDNQIKHLGYRIELGEIENAAFSINGVECAVGVYDRTNDKIILVVSGQVTQREMDKVLRTKIPAYMIPNKYIITDRIPLNANGKIDRKQLYRKYIN